MRLNADETRPTRCGRRRDFPPSSAPPCWTHSTWLCGPPSL